MSIDFDPKEAFGISPREFAEKHFKDYKISNGEIKSKRCPYCRGGEHNDLWTFYLNKEDGTYICHRASCEASGGGSFKDLLLDFNEINPDDFSNNNNFQNNNKFKDMSGKRDDFTKPDVEDNTKDTISEDIVDWFGWRGISKETIEDWDIREAKSQDSKWPVVAFPYYEDGEEVLLKYRTANRKGDKSVWQEGGGKKVLWGMDKVDPGDPLVLVEGEVDAVSVYEAGYENVVSVPLGAESYHWVDTCYDFLEQFDEIYLWMDNDEAGQKTTKELINRLGKWRCSVIETGYKDANKMLFMEGKDDKEEGQYAVLEAIHSAEPVEIDGLTRISTVEDFDPAETDRIKSSIGQINHYIRGYRMGAVTVWTGVSGSGKSTFLSQEIVEAIDQEETVCVFSDEFTPPIFRYWTELQMAGTDYVEEKPDPLSEKMSRYVKREYKDKMRSWYRDRFFLYDTSYMAQGTESMSKEDYLAKIATAEKVLKTFEYARRRHGAKVFLLDNLMMVNLALGLHDKYQEQTVFIGMLKDFAHRFGVHIHLVAHPRKEEGEISLQDISGTMDIVNRVDNVIAIKRLSDEDRENMVEEDYPTDWQEADNSMTILKNRMFGKSEVSIPVQFHEKTKRFYDGYRSPHEAYSWVNVSPDKDSGITF